jgi:hypothetical protein
LWQIAEKAEANGDAAKIAVNVIGISESAWRIVKNIFDTDDGWSREQIGLT